MWLEQLQHLLILPRAQQFVALKRLREIKEQEYMEEWNSAFGVKSVYDAWTQLPFMQQLYAANRMILRSLLDQRSYWHLIEIGGGNGALWKDFFYEQEQGMLTLIDPVPEVHTAVAGVLPPNVKLNSYVARIEDVDLPEADGLASSLMLHHIAGQDARQRSRFGMDGIGKFEILQRFVQAIQARRGLCLLNEADIYNEIDFEPGDPVLIEHFIDIYVRRAAMGVAVALEQLNVALSLKQRWEIILLHWCLDQVDLALATREQRDVYELDVPHWLSLLQRADAHVLEHCYTDEWYLFHQYIFTAAEQTV